MAFVTTPISRNKVRVECNALPASGVIGAGQILDLAADADTAPLIGGALPASGATVTDALCQTHLRFTVETAADNAYAVHVRSMRAEVFANANVPSLRFSLMKNGGGDDGVIIGILERIQSPAL